MGTGNRTRGHAVGVAPPRVRRMMPDPRLGETEFKQRFLAQYRDPAFAAVADELARMTVTGAARKVAPQSSAMRAVRLGPASLSRPQAGGRPRELAPTAARLESPAALLPGEQCFAIPELAVTENFRFRLIAHDRRPEGAATIRPWSKLAGRLSRGAEHHGV